MKNKREFEKRETEKNREFEKIANFKTENMKKWKKS